MAMHYMNICKCDCFIFFKRELKNVPPNFLKLLTGLHQLTILVLESCSITMCCWTSELQFGGVYSKGTDWNLIFSMNESLIFYWSLILSMKEWLMFYRLGLRFDQRKKSHLIFKTRNNPRFPFTESAKTHSRVTGRLIELFPRKSAALSADMKFDKLSSSTILK
jgi:hypothetical protein